AKIICGHTGGDWEQGIRAVRAQPNISVDLGGGDPVAGITEMAVRELGPGRVLYGSDAPGRSFASQLAKVHGAHVSDADKEKIFATNLKRLLTPILKDKGIKVWPRRIQKGTKSFSILTQPQMNADEHRFQEVES